MTNRIWAALGFLDENLNVAARPITKAWGWLTGESHYQLGRFANHASLLVWFIATFAFVRAHPSRCFGEAFWGAVGLYAWWTVHQLLAQLRDDSAREVLPAEVAVLTMMRPFLNPFLIVAALSPDRRGSLMTVSSVLFILAFHVVTHDNPSGKSLAARFAERVSELRPAFLRWDAP